MKSVFCALGILGLCCFSFICGENRIENKQEKSNQIFVESLVHDNDVLRIVRKRNRHTSIYFYPAKEFGGYTEENSWRLNIDDGDNSIISGKGSDLNLAFEDWRKEYKRLHPL